MSAERSLSSWCVSKVGRPTRPDYTWSLVVDVPYPAEVALPILHKIEEIAVDVLRRELPNPRRPESGPLGDLLEGLRRGPDPATAPGGGV